MSRPRLATVLVVVTPGFSDQAFLPLLNELKAQGEEVQLLSFACAGQSAEGLVDEIVEASGEIGTERAIVAHGVGATLVAMAAPRLDAERLVLLAPVLDVQPEPVALTRWLLDRDFRTPWFASIDLGQSLEWNGREVADVLLGDASIPLTCVSADFVGDVLSWAANEFVPVNLEAIPMPVWVAVSAGDEVATVETAVPASRRIPKHQLVRLGLNRLDPHDFSHGQMLVDPTPVRLAARAVEARLSLAAPLPETVVSASHPMDWPPPPTTKATTPLGEGVDLYRVETADGGEIALTHRGPKGGIPVVLCHGISSNHWFWDLEPGRSLVEWLSDRGFDVWNLDLRGHGYAERRADGRRQRSGWNVDDYGRYDLPAAFDTVRAETGIDRLHYVGHSLGGMVLAIYLSTYMDTQLASAVTVGSPLDFRDPDRTSAFLLNGSAFGRWFASLPSPLGGRILSALDTRAPLHADEFFYNPPGMAEDVRRLAMRRVISPLSRGEVKQMGQMAKDGVFRSADGTIDYRAMLSSSVVPPMLLIAGRADRIASADRIRGYYDALGGEPHDDKEFVIASIANGFYENYGHLDFGLGDHAAEDVFPRIEQWLRAHP